MALEKGNLAKVCAGTLPVLYGMIVSICDRNNMVVLACRPDVNDKGFLKEKLRVRTWSIQELDEDEIKEQETKWKTFLENPSLVK